MPRTMPAVLVALSVGAIVAFAYAQTLAPGITWSNRGLDSAELIAAAVTGGVPHPSGYPTYLLAAELFLLLPGDDPAVKVTLLSATAATLAVLVLFATVLRLTRPSIWAPVAAAGAALTLGLAPLFWSQAVIAEVYSLNALFSALLLRATILRAAGLASDGPRHAAVWSLVAGLALGNHLTILPLVLTWLVVASSAGGRPHPGRLARALTWFGAGLLVYLALPLRAAGDPPINWGGADEWQGFWWLVSARLYAGYAFGVSVDELPARIWQTLTTLGAQVGPAGLLLAGYGAARLARIARLAWWLTVALAVLIAGFTTGYATVDAQVYLLPTVQILALWLGLGLCAVLERAASVSRRAALLTTGILALVLLWPTPTTARQVNAAADQRAIVFALQTLNQAPPSALIITGADRDTFPLWYYHFGLGLRPDLTVVAENLLDFPWYRRSLHDRYPRLVLPETAPAGWEAALRYAHAGAGPVCRTRLRPAPYLTC